MSELIINSQNPLEFRLILNDRETDKALDRLLEFGHIMGKSDGKSDGKKDAKPTSDLSDMRDLR
tara:strand:+ start:1467 stop:1658 length:192 start_codon:yes stop_codon:yes gene_type:complete